jgi:hypothetical protein
LQETKLSASLATFTVSREESRISVVARVAVVARSVRTLGAAATNAVVK